MYMCKVKDEIIRQLEEDRTEEGRLEQEYERESYLEGYELDLFNRDN